MGLQFSGGMLIGLHVLLRLFGDKGIAVGIIIGLMGLCGKFGADAKGGN